MVDHRMDRTDRIVLSPARGRPDDPYWGLDRLVPADGRQLLQHGQPGRDVGGDRLPANGCAVRPGGHGLVQVTLAVAGRQQRSGGGVQLMGGLGDQVIGDRPIP